MSTIESVAMPIAASGEKTKVSGMKRRKWNLMAQRVARWEKNNCSPIHQFFGRGFEQDILGRQTYCGGNMAFLFGMLSKRFVGAY